jgi:endonuclease III
MAGGVMGRGVREAMMKKKARSHEGTQAHSGTKQERPARATARGATPSKSKWPRETAEQRRARAERLLAKLRAAYPEATCALHHRSALELLVATILSAQCTDERVNLVTPDLFRRYPDARALAAADPAELEAAIRSTGFFRNKTKSLLGMSRLVCEEFGGQVPDTMGDLLRLPGVARKTANCVLGTWYGQNVGIVVDTHVGRLAERLGLTTTARDSKDAEKIERDLMKLFPQDAWTYLAHALIQHGRQICLARKPKCDQCPLAEDCPSAFEV